MRATKAIIAILALIGLYQPAVRATEPMLQKVTEASLNGGWEGAWRDKVVGRLIVIYLEVAPNSRGVLTLVHGPENPITEPFVISQVRCVDGAVQLEGAGVGDAAGESITLNGPGWASAQDGFVDASIRKTTHSGKVLTFDVRLNKFAGGFFKNAEQLVRVAKKRMPADSK